MTPETRTRQIVRGYHDARFRGNVPAAVVHLAGWRRGAAEAEVEQGFHSESLEWPVDD
ncbi:hypothetical protein ABT218_38620 [Streptomyces sp. NPDC001455]|uniref:hypothetical protein n=1 Tax=unclassified Streptomyces TaxID=2593676 RepID=UPI00331B7B1E